MKRKRQNYTEAELCEQAIRLLWNKHQYEDAISLVKRLLRLKPRYPLYYLILSDCYKGIYMRSISNKEDVKAHENSVSYWNKAFDFDGEFVRSEYYEQGIKEAAHYLLLTQDLEKLTEIETKKLQELSTKQITSGELYDAVLGQASASEDPVIRLKYFETSLKKAKAGYNQNLYAFDSEGNAIKPTFEEFVKAKAKNPKQQLLFTLSHKDPITGEETQYTFNILKYFNFSLPSESVIKARQRRRRYYYSHQKERQEYQRLYDGKNRQRKRVRNKLDYSWRQSGLTKQYLFREPEE